MGRHLNSAYAFDRWPLMMKNEIVILEKGKFFVHHGIQCRYELVVKRFYNIGDDDNDVEGRGPLLSEQWNSLPSDCNVTWKFCYNVKISCRHRSTRDHNDRLKTFLVLYPDEHHNSNP